LEAFFASIGAVVVALEPSDPVCGVAILEGSGNLAKQLENLAKQNPRIEKALRSMLSTGAWSGVAIAAGTIALPILQHHGFVPTGVSMPTFEMPDIPMEDFEPEPPTPNGQVNEQQDDLFSL
jgi:hypothetical protein